MELVVRRVVPWSKEGESPYVSESLSAYPDVLNEHIVPKLRKAIHIVKQAGPTFARAAPEQPAVKAQASFKESVHWRDPLRGAMEPTDKEQADAKAIGGLRNTSESLGELSLLLHMALSWEKSSSRSWIVIRHGSIKHAMRSEPTTMTAVQLGLSPPDLHPKQYQRYAGWSRNMLPTLYLRELRRSAPTWMHTYSKDGARQQQIQRRKPSNGSPLEGQWGSCIYRRTWASSLIERALLNAVQMQLSATRQHSRITLESRIRPSLETKWGSISTKNTSWLSARWSSSRDSSKAHRLRRQS